MDVRKRAGKNIVVYMHRCLSLSNKRHLIFCFLFESNLLTPVAEVSSIVRRISRLENVEADRCEAGRGDSMVKSIRTSCAWFDHAVANLSEERETLGRRTERKKDKERTVNPAMSSTCTFSWERVEFGGSSCGGQTREWRQSDPSNTTLRTDSLDNTPLSKFGGMSPEAAVAFPERIVGVMRGPCLICEKMRL